MLSFTSGFPEGRCYVHGCQATPYDLKWTSVTYDTSNNMKACITFDKKQCVDSSKYNCCNLFSTFLEKFVISSNVKCKNALKGVTVNGNNKGGGVYFDI